MKRTGIGLWVLTCVGLVLGSGDILKQGDTAPTMKFVVRTASGVPVTGLTNADLAEWYIQEANSDSTTELDGTEISITDSALADPNSAWSSGGIAEIGHGMYRLDLPAAAVAGAAGSKVAVTIFYDTTTDIYIFSEFTLTPPVNVLLTNGTTTPALNVADGIVEANIKEIDDDATADGNLKLMFNGTGYAGGTTKLNVGLSAAGLDADAALEIWAGPNYANASTELDGAVENTSLSTTSIIYLTATSAANDKQYEQGRWVAFADTNGVYHFGEIDYYSATTDTIFLKTPVPVAPVNLTPIYVFREPKSMDAESISPPGGTTIVSGTLTTECTTTFLRFDSTGMSAVSHSYDGFKIKITYASPSAGVPNPIERTIGVYTGDVAGSNADYTASISSALPQAPASGDLYVIYEPDPGGTGSDFGPNAGKAISEDGTKTSTATTIYLSSADTNGMYYPGTIVRFVNASEIYNDAVVRYAYSVPTGAITLYAGYQSAPANGAIIYPIGFNFSAVTNTSWESVSGESGFSTVTDEDGSTAADGSRVWVSPGSTSGEEITLSSNTLPGLMYQYLVLRPAAGGKSVHVIRGYGMGVSSAYLDVFPRIPSTFTLADGDQVSIVPYYSGLIPADLAKMPN